MTDDSIEEGVFTNTKKYIRKTDEEIKKIARGIYKNEYFSSMQINPNDSHLIINIFMPLAFMSPLDRKQLIVDEIVHFYGELDGAATRSINGYPCLFSMHMLNKEDTDRVLEEYDRIIELLGE